MFISDSNDKNLFSYLSTTFSYWLFMLSDGALRMIVLFNFHSLGYTPIKLAYIFLIYELMGMVANLYAGWLAARFGLTITLYLGFIIQILALGLLTFANDFYLEINQVFFVMLIYGLSGLSKDLTKMSAKSAVKLVVKEGENKKLFNWISILTGSKNTIKGIGFFLGAILIGYFDYKLSLIIMACILFLVVVIIYTIKPIINNKKLKKKDIKLFSTVHNINLLSISRFFLFGARDIWFVVSLPVFFYIFLESKNVSQFSNFLIVGGSLAIWIIFYGFIQSFAPKIINFSTNKLQESLLKSKPWFLSLLICSGLISLLSIILSNFSLYPYILLISLFFFGFFFALNSSVHSYLIVSLSNKENITLDVGFYYMSNAAGRFIGTLLSGLSYQLYGIKGSLILSTIFIALSYSFYNKIKYQKN